MNPGRDLDELVAQEVMNLAEIRRQRPSYGNGGSGPLENELVYGIKKPGVGFDTVVPHYSTSIAAAWEVVEKLKHLEPEIEWSDEHQCWHMTLWKGANQGMMPGSASAPHAICRAALKAVGVEV